MRFQAAVSLGLAGTAIAAGAADNVIKVLQTINSDLQNFDKTIKAYSGGPDTSALTAASNKIESDTKSGASSISSGGALSETDAVGITSAVTGLQGTLDQTLNDLQAIGDKLASAGQCSTIQGQLKSQYTAAGNLADAIADKTPPDLKGVGKTLSGQISTSIKNTETFFEKACAGAPSGPPAGGSSAGPKTSGGGPSSGGPPSGGSSTTNGAPGGSSSTNKKPATTSSPAVFKSGASSLTAPALLCALVLAIVSL